MSTQWEDDANRPTAWFEALTADGAFVSGPAVPENAVLYAVSDIADVTEDPWFEVRTASGHVIRTNDNSTTTLGVTFLSVVDDEETVYGWWAPESWGTPDTSAEGMKAVALAAGGVVNPVDGEITCVFTGGVWRVASDGGRCRVEDVRGKVLGKGDAEWTCAEVALNPHRTLHALMLALGQIDLEES